MLNACCTMSLEIYLERGHQWECGIVLALWFPDVMASISDLKLVHHPFKNDKNKISNDFHKGTS